MSDIVLIFISYTPAKITVPDYRTKLAFFFLNFSWMAGLGRFCGNFPDLMDICAPESLISDKQQHGA
jgi:hypothetical protein